MSRLTSELRAAAGRELVIGVDQEGGIVTRLGPAHGFPPVASQASVGQGTKAEARTWARDLAATLATSGFTLNFAPVVDLDVNPSSPAIGALDRSFSADPDVVVEMATIEIRAHHQAGVRTTLKHFPGIGSSTTNTDFGVADVTDSWHRVELEPFRRLIAAGLADVVMAGHVVNRRLDPDHPASLSKAVVTDLLRGELGWDGIVVTDDLQAAAITDTFGADEAVLLALEAGNDLLLFANQQVYEPDVVQRVVGVVADAVASGRLTRSQIEASWARVQRHVRRHDGRSGADGCGSGYLTVACFWTMLHLLPAGSTLEVRHGRRPAAARRSGRRTRAPRQTRWSSGSSSVPPCRRSSPARRGGWASGGSRPSRPPGSSSAPGSAP